MKRVDEHYEYFNVYYVESVSKLAAGKAPVDTITNKKLVIASKDLFPGFRFRLLPRWTMDDINMAIAPHMIFPYFEIKDIIHIEKPTPAEIVHSIKLRLNDPYIVTISTHSYTSDQLYISN
jgi:hypothetical protein